MPNEPQETTTIDTECHLCGNKVNEIELVLPIKPDPTDRAFNGRKYLSTITGKHESICTSCARLLGKYVFEDAQVCAAKSKERDSIVETVHTDKTQEQETSEENSVKINN